MKRIAYFLLIAVVLVGCKSSKRLTATKVPPKPERLPNRSRSHWTLLR